MDRGVPSTYTRTFGVLQLTLQVGLLDIAHDAGRVAKSIRNFASSSFPLRETPSYPLNAQDPSTRQLYHLLSKANRITTIQSFH